MQQMHDAGLSAALTEGQAAGHAAPLHGKPQNALAVGAAGGGRLALGTAASSQAASMSRSNSRKASHASGLNQCRQATA